MLPKTPTEVRRAIAADFKLKGITHFQAAEDLGYKSKQSVSAILTSKVEAYLPFEQASRFHIAYNYNLPFLTKGEGELYTEKDPIEFLIKLRPPFTELSPELLSCIIDIARGIIETTGNRLAEHAWKCALKGDYKGYESTMKLLAQQTNEAPIIPSLAQYVIDKIGEKNKN